MPSLINDTKNKELESAFKKSYSALSQAMQLTVMNDYFGSLNISSHAELYNIIKNLSKYMRNTGYCSLETKYTKCPAGFVYETAGADAAQITLKKYKNYTGGTGGGFFNDGGMLLSDGSYILFDIDSNHAVKKDENDEELHIYVAVDVNGAKKPNRYGYDFFVFEFGSDGRLIPSGSEDTVFTSEKYCVDSNTNVPYNGFGCTERAFIDHDYFKNLK